MKIWTSTQEGDDKLVAFVNQTIYRGSSKLAAIDKAILELKTSVTPPGELTGVPVSYIKEINMVEGKNQLELLFGRDSSEELKISADKTRAEIFEYFKTAIPGAEYRLVKYTALRAGRKPLIALVVVTVIFAWTLNVAIGKESGNQYDVSGQHYNSLAGIVLAMASIGVKNVVLVFGSLMLIAILSFIKKARNPPVKHQLLLRCK